jgi:hypothetical protein
MKTLILLLSLSSCSVLNNLPVSKDASEYMHLIGVKGVEVTNDPTLDVSRSAIWQSYGETGPVPAVLAVSDPLDLTCPSGKAFVAVTMAGPQCVTGFTFLPFTVSVVRMPGQLWSDTSLAHELMHAHQSLHFVFEANHNGYQGPNWGPGGLVEQATGIVKGIGQ